MKNNSLFKMCDHDEEWLLVKKYPGLNSIKNQELHLGLVPLT